MLKAPGSSGQVLSTAENLQDAIKGETYEFESFMYPEFLKTEEESNKTQSGHSLYAMEAEKVHAKLYKEALENIDETEEVFYYLCPFAAI